MICIPKILATAQIWCHIFRRVNVSMGGNAGLITYGEIDNINCYPSINYVKLSSLTYWQFPLGSFSVGSYVNTKTVQAISDTGTSWIGAPVRDLNAIVQATNAQYDFFNDLYFVQCDAVGLPDLILTIGSQQYKIPQVEYVIDVIF